jgi:glycerophosphoryl diester phosphodiesterase
MKKAPPWLTARPIAHRGWHDDRRLPENSLSAIAAAVDRGFAVEMDLRLSRDGEVVVFHDATLERMTGTAGRIDALTWPELAALHLRDTADHIPVLADVLVRVAGRTPLFLELKVEGDEMPALASATTDLLSHYGGPCAVMSFHPGVLREVRRLAPATVIGLLSCRFDDEESLARLSRRERLALRNLLPALSLRPDFIAYDIAALPALAPLLMRRLLRRPLIAWTVRTAEDRRRAARMADQIIYEGFDPDAVPSPAARS